ncbi:hypothetical protein Tco_1456020 [Tanacetum coccineum]
MAQFWHTLKEDGSKHRLKFLLDRKELTLTLDDFRTIFHLPQANDNNHASFIATTTFSDNDLGPDFNARYTPSAYLHVLRGLVPTAVADKGKFILLVNNILWGLCGTDSRCLINNLQDDDIMKNIFNSGRNKNKRFWLDVPLTQSQPTESTHNGPHSNTYIAPKSHNPAMEKTIKECECLAQKLSKQTESVNKEVHNNLLKSFSKLEKHSISLELALQQCKEQMKNNSVCKENGSNVFRKEREQYHEIQDLKAQMQDKNIAISELKKLIENCKGKSVETQFNKPSVVRQPNAQRIPKPSVLGKPTPFSNSPEMRSFQTKQSVNKTNVSDGLFKQVTQQNLPQIRKQAVRNTNVIAPGPSRNCPKHVSHQSPREKVGSNDMVHNYYLEKAKKSAQLQKDKEVNGKPSMIDPARLPNTANGCKPKPRNWQASMSSRVSNKDVHLGEHRKQKPFLKFNDLQCPTCKKCLYSANHDECVLEYLSRPVEKSSASKKPERQIPTGHRFSNKKTTTVLEKTMTHRSCLSWKPMGRIFKTIGLRWVPTGKIFAFSTNKVDNEPPNGSIVDITNQCESEQALNVSACSSGLVLHQMTSDHNRSELRIQGHSI